MVARHHAHDDEALQKLGISLEIGERRDPAGEPLRPDYIPMGTSRADWLDHRFRYGLYVNPTSFAGQKFPVIGYWVE